MDHIPVPIPVPKPVKIHIHDAWVRVLMDTDTDSPKFTHGLPVSNTMWTRSSSGDWCQQFSPPAGALDSD